MMKSGLPPLKISLALDFTHTQLPDLLRSLKTVRPVSPVLITGKKTKGLEVNSVVAVDIYLKETLMCN